MLAVDAARVAADGLAGQPVEGVVVYSAFRPPSSVTDVRLPAGPGCRCSSPERSPLGDGEVGQAVERVVGVGVLTPFG